MHGVRSPAQTALAGKDMEQISTDSARLWVSIRVWGLCCSAVPRQKEQARIRVDHAAAHPLGQHFVSPDHLMPIGRDIRTEI